MSDQDAAVEIRDVDFRYDGPLALESVNLTVPVGEFLGIIGPNGGGKTTLLKLILGLEQPERGEVRVLGGTPQSARLSMGYVPQSSDLQLEFPITVQDVVLTGRVGQSRLVWSYRQEDRQAAAEALEAVELADLRDRVFGSLSGGQRKRALIARALATRPELLLLDEPTAEVDHHVEHEIYALLEELSEEMTILLVSHDVGCVTEHVGRVACVHQRVFCHTTEELTGEVIEAIYSGPVRMVEHHNE